MNANATAIFKCQHQTAIGISWQVNGSSVKPNNVDITPSTVRDNDQHLVYVLTILARLEYNGTEIECVAIFIDGFQVTPTVMLTVLEGLSIMLQPNECVDMYLNFLILC